MQEYFEVKSLALLVLSISLTGFLITLFFIEYSNVGTILVIEGETISRESNFSITAKINNGRTFRIFFIQVFTNLSWKLLLNESSQLHETKNNEINFLIRVINERGLEIFVNKKEHFAIGEVKNIKQSSFLVFIIYDPNDTIEK